MVQPPMNADKRRWKTKNLSAFIGGPFAFFLLALLNFKEDRFRHARVVLLRVDFAGLEEDPSEINNALLRNQHLAVGFNHGSRGLYRRSSAANSFWFGLLTAPNTLSSNSKPAVRGLWLRVYHL
jgi:hypothetical protein